MKIKVDETVIEYVDINDPVFEAIFRECAANCMWTRFHSIEPLYTLYADLQYIVKNDVPGDIVECGVWCGGMTQLAALTLQDLGDTSRRIYLYDRFDGMPEPRRARRVVRRPFRARRMAAGQGSRLEVGTGRYAG